MSIPTELAEVIVIDPGISGGTPCFAGTRVLLETFLDYIGEGSSVEFFLRGFPSVWRVQAMTVLEWETDQAKRVAGLDLVA